MAEPIAPSANELSPSTATRIWEVSNNPAFEFAGGFGTIEALVYLSPQSAANATIVSEGYDGGSAYYSIGVDSTGGFLLYSNDSTPSLSSAVPGGLTGKFADIALVFDSGVNVTAYVNGQSLGTQAQPSFGSTPGGSFWIGGIGNQIHGARWTGTIDELAIYSTNMTAATFRLITPSSSSAPTSCHQS